MSNIIHGRNPLWSPEYTQRKPSFNDMGAMRLNPDHRLNQGLVAWWLMNERAGGSLYDVSKKHLGTIVQVGNEITWLPDGELSFINTAGYVSNLSIADSDVTGAITLLCSAYLSIGSTSHSFAAKCASNGATNNPFDFRTNSDAALKVNFVRANSTEVKGWASVSTIPLLSYNIIGITLPSGVVGDTPSIYINGMDAGASSMFGSGTGVATGSNQPVWVGKRADGGAILYGKMRWFAIYKRALPQHEVTMWSASPYGTPSSPRFLVEPRRTWFVPSGAAPPPTVYHQSMTMGMGQ
jgi:hypothetical protein